MSIDQAARELMDKKSYFFNHQLKVVLKKRHSRYMKKCSSTTNHQGNEIKTTKKDDRDSSKSQNRPTV
jgi:hypothetical protein